jgi:FdhD protein
MTEPHGEATHTRPVSRLRNGQWQQQDDTLVVEEPLEIRIGNRRFTATMRTPGDDFYLARGLLLSEGIIDSLDDIGEMRWCDTGESDEQNIIQVQLKRSAVPPHLWERNLISNSSCGLCGKASIESLSCRVEPLPDTAPVNPEIILSLTAALRASQKLFDLTGGLHAAGIFNAQGEPLAVYEDIGRHNATDKAIGYGLTQGFLPHHREAPLILLVSGRASFEIVQKALAARIAIVCAVSAASNLAVDLATANNQTLIGFLRESGFTIYAGQQRIAR